MKKRSLLTDCIAALLLLLPLLPATADDGKTRYVSGTGVDSGDCLNKFRPCRTLSYTIARAGKTDTLWVAAGDYPIRSAEQLTELMSITGRVRAGFDPHTGFSDRNAADRTLLIGVPPLLRERFEAAGFSVIADIKSIDSTAVSQQEAQRMRAFTSQVAATEKSHAAAPCVGGMSANFPCQSISLASHMPLSQLQPASDSGADLWGYTDLNTGREYVVMGLSNGVAVVDVTDPESPTQIAYTTGSNTSWRELTIYQTYDRTSKRWRAYAYGTVDGGVPDRLLLLDLSDLPNGIERVNFTSDFGTSHTDYLVNADYTFGIAESSAGARLIISGARNTAGGNFRLYTLEQPRTPQLRSVGNRGYAHDVASFGVSDARKDTQCVNAAAAAKCQVLVDFNETSVDTWDVTNPSVPRALGRHVYDNSGYVHSGWWTEDGRYLFVHDEFDERDHGLNTFVRVFDMANLASPTLVGSWTGSNRAIDHNGYAKGNRYYFSNYTEGLTVLDITNPVAPTRIGYFDTFPGSAQLGFVGAWGAYPYFASGTIAIADINSGLYLLRNESLIVPQGTLAFATPSVNGAEGENATITVNRTGGSTGAVSVELDYLHATTDANDVILTTQTLSWADGDAQPKSAALALTVDAENEDLELLLVRLRNPRGGATINYPDTAQVQIAESGATTRVRILDSDIAVNEIRGHVFVTVTRSGSLAGGASVNYTTLSNSTYTGFTPTQGTLSWANGDGNAKIITIDFEVTRLQPGESGTFQVELSAAVSAELENAAGAVVASTMANVTVTDPLPPPAPVPAAPRSSSRGGGSMNLWGLALTAGLLSWVATSRNRPPKSVPG